MNRLSYLLGSIVLVALVAVAPAPAASEEVAEPFKLGTFEIRGKPTLGLVLRDQFVVELKAANRDLERSARFAEIPMAADMKELAARITSTNWRRPSGPSRPVSFASTTFRS